MGTPAVDDAVLAPVLAAYSLHGARVLGLVEASNRNDNVLVVDATGARYVLRRCRRNPNARRVEFQVRFQQHLRRYGFPTAEVVETRAGTGFVLAADGFPWVLFTHVEQTGPRPPLHLCGMKPTDSNLSLVHQLARRLLALTRPPGPTTLAPKRFRA